MTEEVNKLKQQIEVEEQNEEIMNMLLNHTIIHIEKEEDVIELMKQIREYREKIFNLKLKLGEYLTRAYEEKNSSVLEKLRKRMESYKDETFRASIKCFIEDENNPFFREVLAYALTCKLYPIQALAKYDAITDEGRYFFTHTKYKPAVLSEQNSPGNFCEMPKCELDIIRMINISNMNTIFNYYENELQFWEKMNLKKQIDFTEEEQCLE